jgi:hypothetical protein
MQNDLVWELTDFFNYLMVFPNALALIALYKVIVNEVKLHDARKKKGQLKKNGEPFDDLPSNNLLLEQVDFEIKKEETNS